MNQEDRHRILNAVVCIEGIKKKIEVLIKELFCCLELIDSQLSKIESTVKRGEDMPGINWQELINRVKMHEGFRSKPYKDTAGKLTIGYGRNLDDVGISEQEAEIMLRNDLKNAYLSYLREFPPSAKKNLTPDGESVIVEMIFNMGISKVLGFKRMIQAIIDKDPERAAAEMLDSRWANQVGERAVRLADIMREKGIVS